MKYIITNIQFFENFNQEVKFFLEWQTLINYYWSIMFSPKNIFMTANMFLIEIISIKSYDISVANFFWRVYYTWDTLHLSSNSSLVIFYKTLDKYIINFFCEFNKICIMILQWIALYMLQILFFLFFFFDLGK